MAFPVPEEDFHKLFIHFALETGWILYKDKFGFIDGKLVYLNAKVDKKEYMVMPFEGAQGVRDNLMKLVTDFNEKAPAGVNKAYLSAYDRFAWLHAKELFMSIAVQGCLLSCGICYVVLVMMTGNFLLSTYAIVSIGSIIFTIMATIRFMGWDFGFVQCTCIIVFIGISFDYVVHISH